MVVPVVSDLPEAMEMLHWMALDFSYALEGRAVKGLMVFISYSLAMHE